MRPICSALPAVTSATEESTRNGTTTYGYHPLADLVQMLEGWPLRAGGPTLAAAVHAARGKFLIDWRPVPHAGPGLLAELASHLEEDVVASAAAVEAARHPTLWRRWCLLDPQASPESLIKAGPRAAGPPLTEADYRGAFPHSRWAIDPGALQGHIYRVRPEVEGRFPDWLP